MDSPIEFGRYLLLDRLSVGGMAEVFLAKSIGLGGFEKILAIKRILPSVSEDSDFTTMFIDEAKISANLSHNSIAQIFEFGQVGGQYYIAMEYIPGRDLRSIQARLSDLGRVMDVPMVLHVGARLCQALDYAHRQKNAQGVSMDIVHRDISPPNVILSYEGGVKLIDFGIAKAASRATRTRAGKLKGKFAYMSPEQVQGIEVDRRSDIFSLGVLLHELLTNQRLFHADHQIATLNLVRKAEVAPPSASNPEVPLEIDRIVLKALARDPDQRYAWASELRADLERYVARSGCVFESAQLAAWMRNEFAGELEAERRLIERIHQVQPRQGQPLPAPAVENAVAEAPYEEESATRSERGPALGHPDEPSDQPAPSRRDRRHQTSQLVVPLESIGLPAEERPLGARRSSPGSVAPQHEPRGAHTVSERPPLDEEEDLLTEAQEPLGFLDGDQPTEAQPPSAFEDEDLEEAVLDPDDLEEDDGEQDGEAADGLEADRDDQPIDRAAEGEDDLDGEPTPLTVPPELLPHSAVRGPRDSKEHRALAHWPTEVHQTGEEVLEQLEPTPRRLVPVAASRHRTPRPDRSVAIAPGPDRDAAFVGGAVEVDSRDIPPAPRVDAGPQVELHGDGLVWEPQPRAAQPSPVDPPSWTRDLIGSGSPRARMLIAAIAGVATMAIAGVVLLAVWALGRGSHPAPAQTGSLVITTRPPASCSVALDGAPKGMLDLGGSLRLSGVAPGKRIITVQCLGYEIHEQTTEVQPSQANLIVAPLTKRR